VKTETTTDLEDLYRLVGQAEHTPGEERKILCHNLLSL